MAQPSEKYAKRKKAAFDLFHQGHYSEAHELAVQLCAKNRRDLEVRSLLSHALMRLGHLEEAARSFRTIVKKAPQSWRAHYDLASIAQLLGQHQEAVDHYQEAAGLNTYQAAIPDSLGVALCCQGRYEAAIAAHHRALDLDPNFAQGRSNLLLTLHYLPEVDRELLLQEHRAWGEHHGIAPRTAPPTNDPDPDRRLRIAYLSADLRTHSVAYFVEPLLAAHHRDAVEVWCYSNLAGGDVTTGRLRSLADGWREVAGQPPEAIARQIRADRIDLLVELGGHTANALLRACAHRPAPVQVTYLGYPDTTGLSAIDYRLVDQKTDPPGSERWCIEKLVRLPGCFLCYRPPTEAPPVAPLPAEKRGFITFGSFNNLAKVNQEVVSLWAQVIHAVEGSCLLIKAPSLDDPTTRNHYQALFRSHGVGPDRIVLRGRTREVTEHLALYGEVDIALDPFPYNGTTTTCEALTMGVPVVTLVGDTHAGRVGASLLNSIGLDELVADDQSRYVDVASQLASDRNYRATLRAALRDQVHSSPLCDADAFCHKLEDAYRDMWKAWCTV